MAEPRPPQPRRQPSQPGREQPQPGRGQPQPGREQPPPPQRPQPQPPQRPHSQPGREPPPSPQRPQPQLQPGRGQPQPRREPPPPLSAPPGWRDRLAGLAGFARRRLTGDYQLDEFGFDPEFNATVLMPAALGLYRNWFRVQMRGVANIPSTGRALIVANHSGVLPLDAIMLQAGLYAEHPAHRNLRLLGADLVYTLPLLADLARRSGHTRADPGQAHRLLEAGELVGVFPEGFKGTGKPYRERYRLQRFGRGGFARTAVQAGAPIIPCAIVGAEEIYPMIANAEALARALRLPYFPVTPLFPWLGPLGAVPLPSNWIIEFSEPVPTSEMRDSSAEAADESRDELVADLADQVRDIIQARLDALVAERGPAFG